MKLKPIIFVVIIIAVALVFVLGWKPTSAAVMRIIYTLRWTDGLVGYWSFDGPTMTNGVVLDVSGNNNTGYMVGGMSTTTQRVSGMVGQALSFDGSDDYVNVSGWSPLSSPITFSAWVYVRNSSANQIIISQQASVNSTYLRINAGNFQFCINNTSCASVSIPAVNAWYFVVGTYDSSLATQKKKVYLNSGAPGTSNYTNAITVDSTGLLIGTYSPTLVRCNCSIDEVRVYNRALSPAEIEWQYQRTARQYANKINASQKDKFTNGLVGYWTFNGQDMTTGLVEDVSGQGNHGNQLGGISTTTQRVPGVIGQALDLGPNNGCLNLGSNSSLNLTSALTISAWVKRENNPSRAILVWKVNQYGLLLGDTGGDTSDNRPNFPVMRTSSWRNTLATDAIDTEWHHIVGTFNGSDSYLYVDGVQKTSTNVGGNIDSQVNNPVTVGSYSTTGACDGWYYAGKIDEVRIYNRALSSEEILEMYQSAAPAYRSQVNAPQKNKLTNGLVGYWSFDGPTVNWSTKTILDLSGQGRNATTTVMAAGNVAPGIAGQALSLNGSSGRASLADIDYTTPDKMSGSLWVRFSEVSSQQMLFNQNGSATEIIQMQMQGSGGSSKFRIRIDSASGSDIVDSTTQAVANQWYYIAWTYDGTDVALYVNGINEGDYITNTGSGNLLDGNGNYFIGGYNTTLMTNGQIDEVRVYDRALSAAEIFELYRSAKR